MQKQPQVIRIVKKVKGGGAHHGGSWKVAYADFVTAMMAFFLVMWIISMDQPVRDKIQNYFNNPVSAAESRAGISTLADGGKSPVGMGYDNGMNDHGWRQVTLNARDKALDAQRERLRQAQKSLQEQIARRPELKRLAQQVALRSMGDGLAIELLQVQDDSFFETASAVPTPGARRLLSIIGRELGRVGLPIHLEGHTDVRPFRGKGAYSNWELSADRANAVRRELQNSGVRSSQIAQVTGLAATRLRDPKNPTARANRRVTIFVAIRADENSTAPGPALGEKTVEPAEVSDHEESTPFPIDVRPAEGSEHPVGKISKH